MNFEFNATTGTLEWENIIINPHLTQTEFCLSYKFKAYRNYQDKQIYTLTKKLLFNKQTYQVTTLFKNEQLWIVELHKTSLTPDKENDYLELQFALLKTTDNTFSWGTVYMVRLNEEDSYLQIQYKLKK